MPFPTLNLLQRYKLDGTGATTLASLQAVSGSLPQALGAMLVAPGHGGWITETHRAKRRTSVVRVFKVCECSQCQTAYAALQTFDPAP